MNRQIIFYLNGFFLIGSILFCLLGFVCFWTSPALNSTKEIKKKTYSFPKNNFTRKQQEYDALGEPVLSLLYKTPTPQLPDLRQIFIFCGKNGRPDAKKREDLLHFSLSGFPEIFSIYPNTPLYLQYDKTLTPPRYILSQENAPTSLWIEASPQEKAASLFVRMQNEKGEVISKPENLSHFILKEREPLKNGTKKWEIGKWKVDASLLARQRARWFGSDLFLEKHGGEEYVFAKGKQRIDFGEKEETYSVFVDIGDCLIWENEKWQVTTPGQETIDKPLLVVKKIEDRLMSFEIWDVDGQTKMGMNLIRSKEPWIYHQLQNDFKFVGAKTKTQAVFEIKNERMILRPDDWLIYTESGWKKFTTIEEVDDYVERKVMGPLFVFEGMSKKEDKQILYGILYNKTRTEAQKLEISLQPGGNSLGHAKLVPLETEQEIKKENKEEEKEGDRKDIAE